MLATLALHTSGIAHLDIKPDNFIINDDYSISFIDFGYAQNIQKAVQTKVGTSAYLPPEIEHLNRN